MDTITEICAYIIVFSILFVILMKIIIWVTLFIYNLFGIPYDRDAISGYQNSDDNDYGGKSPLSFIKVFFYVLLFQFIRGIFKASRSKPYKFNKSRSCRRKSRW